MVLKQHKFKILGLLGKTCSFCDFDDVRCLQLDHILGGGYEERKWLNALAIHYKALKNPTGFQILCVNCNWKKRLENKEYTASTNTIKTRPSSSKQQAGIRFERPSMKGYFSEEKKEALRKLLYGP
jgi:hypothetical protein